MGSISRASRARRADEAKKPAVALSKKLQQFYGSHMVSTWQREKVGEIRAVYQDKQDQLDAGHDIASSQLSQEYMAFELEYLETSDRLKEENGGHEPYHKDFRRFISPAFYKAMWRGIKMDTTDRDALAEVMTGEQPIYRHGKEV